MCTAFEQMADRAKREVEKIRCAFIGEICQAFGVCRFGVHFTQSVIVIVTDEPDKLRKEVDTIAEAWCKAFGEKVIVLINDIDFWSN